MNVSATVERRQCNSIVSAAAHAARAAQCANNNSDAVPGGNACSSLSALPESLTTSVYKYREHRTLNLVSPFAFLILQAASGHARAKRRMAM